MPGIQNFAMKENNMRLMFIKCNKRENMKTLKYTGFKAIQSVL